MIAPSHVVHVPKRAPEKAIWMVSPTSHADLRRVQHKYFTSPTPNRDKEGHKPRSEEPYSL